MIIAVVNLSASCPQDKVDFWAAACNAQLLEACKNWGITPTPVIVFDKDAPVPGGCRIMAIVDRLDVAGALGYHTDAMGDVYGRVLYQGDDTSITLSHECLEEVFDPTCDKWWYDAQNNRHVAQEVCDPVEENRYSMDVTVAGETRPVMVSNYVTNNWHTPGAPAPYDRMCVLMKPFDMSGGGYMVVLDAAGEHNVFAARGTAHRMATRSPWRTRRPSHVVGQVHPDKFVAPDSRTLERLRQ